MKKRTRLLAAAAAVVLVLFCGHQLYFRATAEHHARACATAIEAEQLETLTDDPEAWLTAAGIDYVIREGYGYAWTAGDEAKPAFTLTATEDATEGDSLPLALVENPTRTGVTTSPLPDCSAETAPPMVKTLYLYDDYANRMEGDDPSQIEDLMFRAAVDRGMRLFILTPFSDADGTRCTDPAVYAACLTAWQTRIEARGLTRDGTFSCLTLDAQADLPLPAQGQKVLLLLSAVVFPCGAALVVARTAKTQADRQSSGRFLLGLLLWTAAGAALVSAFLTDASYLLGVDIFSGVKVALLTPMAVSGGLLLWTLRHDLLRQTGWKSWLALALVLAAICGVYLLLTTRSGDHPGWTTEAETALRDFLEHTLYVRPRTKELLFAAPCIPLFLWACRRRKPILQLLFGLGVTLESVSVTNTFCHAVAPLSVSVIRSLLGLVIGVMLGVVILGVVKRLDFNS